jgi:RNA-binding protein 26
MRGDLCPYDHGTDPVVVDDVNLPNVLQLNQGQRNSSSLAMTVTSSVPPVMTGQRPMLAGPRPPMLPHQNRHPSMMGVPPPPGPPGKIGLKINI